MPRTRPLDAVEIRVLGALLEKEQATPDHYPLTINALIAACNQKSNRDPVTALSETEVVEALDRLRLDALTWRLDGARAERWEHRLDRRWNLDSARKAVLTLLLLRGPQTPGELKSRSGRLHDFGSLDDVELVLRGLSGGPDDLDALVRELPRHPGERQNRWIHLAGTEDVTEALAESAHSSAATSAPTPPRSVSTAAHGPSALDRIGALETALASLEEGLDALRSDFEALRERLGDS